MRLLQQRENSIVPEEQLPVIAACSDRGWIFSNASTDSLQSKNFMQKNKQKTTIITAKSILIYRC